jgi:ABC-type Fe3+-hydroxamate transport system substrate-binding protein
MKMTRSKKALSFILCIVLIAAIALFTTACNDNKTDNTTTTTESAVSTTESQKATVLGKGETKFNFTVTDLQGNETVFEINTDKKTVGEALLELELIAGDQGDYGLYVKTVNGTTLDYDTDKMYWAFYENGEYAMSGVDSTEITDGKVYEFRAEK